MSPSRESFISIDNNSNKYMVVYHHLQNQLTLYAVSLTMFLNKQTKYKLPSGESVTYIIGALRRSARNV